MSSCPRLPAWLGGPLLATLAFWPSAASEIALAFPHGMPEVRDVSTWETIEGHAEIDDQSIDYTLYVDPRFSALYAITRYRISVVTTDPDGRQTRRSEEEKLIWNSRPGSREPLLCYSAGAVSSGAGAQDRWRSVPAGSEEYRKAMQTAISLYQDHARRLHDAAR